MPPPLVKTPLQKVRWDRAKEIVRDQTKKNQDQFTSQDWGLVVHIMQGMKYFPDEPPKKRRKRKKAMDERTAFEVHANRQLVHVMMDLQYKMGLTPDPKRAVKMLQLWVAGLDQLIENDLWSWRSDNRIGKDEKFKIVKTRKEKLDVVVGQRPATHWDPAEPIEELVEVEWPEVVEAKDVFTFNLNDMVKTYARGLQRLLGVKMNASGLEKSLLANFKQHAKVLAPQFRQSLMNRLRPLFMKNEDDELDVFLQEVVERDLETEWGFSGDVEHKWKTTPLSVTVDKVWITGSIVNALVTSRVKSDLVDYEVTDYQNYDDYYDLDDYYDWGRY